MSQREYAAPSITEFQLQPQEIKINTIPETRVAIFKTLATWRFLFKADWSWLKDTIICKVAIIPASNVSLLT